MTLKAKQNKITEEYAMKNDYEFLLLDLDFTLLNNNREISEKNRLAIKEAGKKGVKTVICTGRSYMSAQKFIDRLELNKKGNYAIAYNGGIIYEPYNNNILTEHKLKKEHCIEIIKELKKFDIGIIVYSTDTLVIEKRTKEIDDYCRISALEPMITLKFEDFIGNNISKILIKANNREVLEKIELHFKALDISKKITMFFSSSDLFEFNPLNIDKGSAVLDLSRLTGIPTSKFIACGDNHNDISMIKNAGLGIAVKNGINEIKAAADYVTQRTNDEDAIAEVIEKFIL